ncbi:hypothetical protein KDW_61910 [Dictyobacter vulcani]|uniref:TIGR00299 family protein n=1 Tax=Dictyobacter vulcani TaxID=2607529 RepID=A0A5J4L166_9CHLR|nr:LarC family nickel insertion protein [Dictyobacter vulcani]GER92029.1 hypothetical protein KDW_61910 [Dictyobacter vulcani]
MQVGALPELVLTRVLACLHRMAEARAIVREIAASKVQFSSRSVAELVAILTGLFELQITELYASWLPLVMGAEEKDGQIDSAFTLEILRGSGARWQPTNETVTLVTPVGAALLATCARFDTPDFSIERIGYGVGLRHNATPLAMRLYLSPADEVKRPATMRLYLDPAVEMEKSASVEGADTDWVAVIESHLDTMTGELLGGLMERLFTLGALDVTYTPIQMKKNRPATLLTVICPLSMGDELALILLRETTTLGVRIQPIRRLKAQREQVQIQTVLGPMLVKIKRLGTQLISASPEYEECQRIATARQIPLAEVYEVARDAIKNAIIEKKDDRDTAEKEK